MKERGFITIEDSFDYTDHETIVDLYNLFTEKTRLHIFYTVLEKFGVNLDDYYKQATGEEPEYRINLEEASYLDLCDKKAKIVEEKKSPSTLYYDPDIAPYKGALEWDDDIVVPNIINLEPSIRRMVVDVEAQDNVETLSQQSEKLPAMTSEDRVLFLEATIESESIGEAVLSENQMLLSTPKVQGEEFHELESGDRISPRERQNKMSASSSGLKNVHRSIRAAKSVSRISRRLDEYDRSREVIPYSLRSGRTGYHSPRKKSVEPMVVVPYEDPPEQEFLQGFRRSVPPFRSFSVGENRAYVVSQHTAYSSPHFSVYRLENRAIIVHSSKEEALIATSVCSFLDRESVMGSCDDPISEGKQ